MTVGQRIKQRRLELGMTLEELGNKLGKNRSTIYRYENGDIENMPLDSLSPIASALQTTPAHLMGWDQEEIDSIASAHNESMEDWKSLIVDHAKWNASQTKWMEEIGTMDFSDDELQQIMDFAKYLLSRRK